MLLLLEHSVLIVDGIVRPTGRFRGRNLLFGE